ncbi:MAG: hypothetical protein ACRDBQ_25270 [Shewanella sp.]
MFALVALFLYGKTFPVFPSSKSSDWSDFGTLISGLFTVIASTVTLAILYVNIREFQKVDANNKKTLEKVEKQLELAIDDNKRQKKLFLTQMRKEQVNEFILLLNDFEELYSSTNLKFNRPYLKMKFFGYLNLSSDDADKYRVDDTILRKAHGLLSELALMARADNFEKFDYATCEVKYSSIIDLMGLKFGVAESSSLAVKNIVIDSEMLLGGTYSEIRNDLVIYQPNIYFWHYMISNIINGLVSFFGVDLGKIDEAAFHKSNEFYYFYIQYIRRVRDENYPSMYKYAPADKTFDLLFDILYNKDDFYLIYHYSESSRKLMERFQCYLLNPVSDFERDKKSILSNALDVFNDIDREIYNKIYLEYENT